MRYLLILVALLIPGLTSAQTFPTNITDSYAFARVFPIVDSLLVEAATDTTLYFGGRLVYMSGHCTGADVLIAWATDAQIPNIISPIDRGSWIGIDPWDGTRFEPVSVGTPFSFPDPASAMRVTSRLGSGDAVLYFHALVLRVR